MNSSCIDSLEGTLLKLKNKKLFTKHETPKKKVLMNLEDNLTFFFFSNCFQNKCFLIGYTRKFTKECLDKQEKTCKIRMIENSRFRVDSKKNYTLGFDLVGPMIHRKAGVT
jgi:hypothetical protein